MLDITPHALARDLSDEFLHGVYGGYMTLPPEKDRASKHGYTAYWK